MSVDSDSITIENVFTKIKEEIQLSSGIEPDPQIPDIMTFCYDKKYLNFEEKKIKLFPMQSIILRTFYRGQRGNEHIRLTKQDLDLLKAEGLDEVIKKYESGKIFRELVLVLGRRAGKDFMTGIMAAYEAMLLLEVPGGSPYRYYDIAEGNPIYILTVATSSDQARVLFNEIKTHVMLSEYFRDKRGDIEADKIWLKTPDDKKRNKEMISDGYTSLNRHLIKGSVCIMSGHSNSDSLLGKGYMSLLFDEVASYKTTGGVGSGERLYSQLGPGTVAFKRPVLDKQGKPVMDGDGNPKMRLDSKIISISSPRGEEGILFKLYQDTINIETRLAFRLPTWKVNVSIPYELLKSENRYMNSEQFNMEFGAEFSGIGGEKFIPDYYVDQGVTMGRELGLDQRQIGISGMHYYAHLDPASTSHNYALVLLHIEERIRYVDKEDGTRKREKVKIFVVDHVMQWQPSGGKAINVLEVDQYIINLAKRFRLAMVSYDVWNSLASIQRLRGKGIPSKQTPFRKQYKMFIYNHLENLLINKQLALPFKGPHAQDLELELKCLKRIFTPTGFKIQPDPEAIKTTDDLCDSLAGACGLAIEYAYQGYPKGTTVYMPHDRNASMQWKIGQGSWSTPQWRQGNTRFGIPSGGY